MARTNNLTNFLTDVASSIRYKTGETAKIAAKDFDTKISSIKTTPKLQTKSITITTNGTQNITADTNYDGLSNVEVTTNVPSEGIYALYQDDYRVMDKRYYTPIPAGKFIAPTSKVTSSVYTQTFASCQPIKLDEKCFAYCTGSGTNLKIQITQMNWNGSNNSISNKTQTTIPLTYNGTAVTVNWYNRMKLTDNKILLTGIGATTDETIANQMCHIVLAYNESDYSVSLATPLMCFDISSVSATRATVTNVIPISEAQGDYLVYLSSAYMYTINVSGDNITLITQPVAMTYKTLFNNTAIVDVRYISDNKYLVTTILNNVMSWYLQLYSISNTLVVAALSGQTQVNTTDKLYTWTFDTVGAFGKLSTNDYVMFVYSTKTSPYHGAVIFGIDDTTNTITIKKPLLAANDDGSAITSSKYNYSYCITPNDDIIIMYDSRKGSNVPKDVYGYHINAESTTPIKEQWSDRTGIGTAGAGNNSQSILWLNDSILFSYRANNSNLNINCKAYYGTYHAMAVTNGTTNCGIAAEAAMSNKMFKVYAPKI